MTYALYPFALQSRPFADAVSVSSVSLDRRSLGHLVLLLILFQFPPQSRQSIRPRHPLSVLW